MEYRSTSYDPFVQVLKETAVFLDADEYSFSKALFEIDLPKRLDWLTKQVYFKGEVSEALMPDAEKLVKLIGGTFNVEVGK